MEKGRSIISEAPGSVPQQSTREQKFTGHSDPTGKIQVIGDIFQFTVDVSEFPPEDVIITSSNNLIEVHAEKLGEDGIVTNTFSHQCKLPADVDPESVKMTVESCGVLTVRAHRM
ncbi:heat shock protein beta-7-like [Thunnus albacares]|uniref:heat shock protein beta-7-like n=1 Tax=Thunnus maccoyii TaxID=8240 RepID=UPI001C4AEE7F|nr:heat shock protein beta-7-like [Thunnus maccoyii]XP_044204669.1 heat shock protein beta-7-like [Thunnus albacares]